MLASRAAGASAASGSSSTPGASSAVASVGAAKGAGGGTAAVAPPSSPSVGAASTSAATRSQPDPPSKPASGQTSAISAIGGQPLAGSGFENERAAKGFRPATGAVSSSDSAASVQQTLFEETGDAAAPGLNAGVSEVTSVHSGSSPVAAPVRATRWMSMASTAQRVQRSLSRAAYKIHAMRRRVPSDAAPSTTPPRMPIDHRED